ncbi:hypothetical protein D043_5288B, partial [Vibrio parahaemolyticus EKP-021]
NTRFSNIHIWKS